MVEGVVSEEELPWLARLRYSGNHSHYRPGQGVLDQSTITIKNLKPNKLAFHYCPKSYCACLLVISNRLSPSLCWWDRGSFAEQSSQATLICFIYFWNKNMREVVTLGSGEGVLGLGRPRWSGGHRHPRYKGGHSLTVLSQELWWKISSIIGFLLF